ncbi:zinc-binding dehydrogenase [Paraburkholderia caledonica]|uniref:zinc-binding dehydrogenase n=1 Tax=Paraburkholderia caledonica TaxID=134536 RepID=UPI0015C67504|nr:zinc-binding dehydrogenase [Paraburkholderia caledonica]
MKAIVYRRNGEPAEVLALEDIPEPAAPGPKEVAIRLVKCMVHPIDDLLIRGYIPEPIPHGGAVPGGDGVAVVEQVGSDVDPSSGIFPGARVVLFPVHGTWVERMVVPETAVIPVPADVSDEAASQVVINGITAIMLMRHALAAQSIVGAASPLLVTAAGSSVARNVIALARIRGTKVVALVRSDASAAILTESFEGLPVVSTEKEEWRAAVAGAHGRSPSVAIDPIGGAMAPDLLGVLSDHGTLLTYGGLDPQPSQISTITLTVRSQAVKGVNAPSWITTTTPEQRVRDIADLFAIVRSAPQNFTEYSEFALADAVSALSAASASPRRGATILKFGI